jgi:hypothetical protein
MDEPRGDPPKPYFRRVGCRRVRRAEQTLLRLVAVAVLAPLLAACGSDSGPTNYLPRFDSFTKSSLAFGEGSKPAMTSLRPVTAADLITTDGQCAASVGPGPVVASASPGQQTEENPAPALIQGGIALQMTECDVVHRAGAPDRFEFGTTDRGERSVTLTYVNGPRPGIYRFAAGRLDSIERGPEPPAPAKPVKAKKPPAKKPAPA